MITRRKILGHLTPKDRGLFEEITGNTIEKLYTEIERLPMDRFQEIFSLEKCLNWAELNQQGLHIFRCILAERMIDTMKRQRGLWDTPVHREYLEQGFVVRRNFLKLDEFREYLHTRTFREDTRAELRRMVQCCVASDGYSGHMGTQKIHYKEAGDDQWEIHVDTYHPTIKFWFYI